MVPELQSGGALCLVVHLVSNIKATKVHRKKQNFIFSLVYWKKEFNSWRVYKPCTTIPILHKGCSYGKSIIVGTKGAIPYTLPPTNPLISLITDLQMDVKRTIWKGHKVYKQDKQEERRKKKLLNRKVRRDVKLWTIFFCWEQKKTHMGWETSPPQCIPPKIKCYRCVNEADSSILKC